MFKTRLTALLCPPPDPVTCNVNVPVGAFGGSVTVSDDAKSGVPDVTVKTPLAPEGSPDTDKATCELKPFRLTTLIWYVVVIP